MSSRDRLTTDHLLALARAPGIPSSILKRAFELGFPPPSRREWSELLVRLFGGLGGALILTSVVFYVAQHWLSLGTYQKYAIFAATIGAFVLVALRQGRTSVAGKVALTCASVAVGGLVAVYAEANPPSQAWPLVAAWSAVILPWCLRAECQALWLFAAGLYNLTLLLYCLETRGVPFFQWHGLELALFALNLTLLVTWDLGYSLGLSWMRPRWLPTCLVAVGLGALTSAAVQVIVEWKGALGQALPVAITMAIAWLGLLHYYANRERDISILGLTWASIINVSLAYLWRFWLDPSNYVSYLHLALAVVAMSTYALSWLRRLPPIARESATPGSLVGLVTRWLASLADEGLIETRQIEELAPVVGRKDESPSWFLQTMVGFAAWIAALFLFLFLLAGGYINEQTGVAYGVMLCAAATLVGYLPQRRLLSEACLSVSLCGQLVAWLVHLILYQDAVSTAKFMFWLEGALAVAYPGPFGRFLSLNMAGLSLALWMSWRHMSLDPLAILAATGMAAVWLLQAEWLASPARAAHNALGLGTAAYLFLLLLLTVPVLGLLPRLGWLAALGLSTVTVATAAAIGANRFQLFLLAILGLMTSSTHGIMAAVLALLLGFRGHCLTLQRLAVIFLVLFGSLYYCQMDLPLATRPAVLLASGFVLVVLAWVSRPPQEGRLES